MGKSLRDVQHLLVFGAEGHADPFAECGTVRAAVHRHIVHLAHGHADQLALRVFLLKMHAAQHTAGRARLVVLHKLMVNAGCRKLVLLIRFHKIAAVIPKHGGFHNLHFRNRRRCKNELSHKKFFSFPEQPHQFSLLMAATTAVICSSVMP